MQKFYLFLLLQGSKIIETLSHLKSFHLPLTEGLTESPASGRKMQRKRRFLKCFYVFAPIFHREKFLPACVPDFNPASQSRLRSCEFCSSTIPSLIPLPRPLFPSPLLSTAPFLGRARLCEQADPAAGAEIQQ